MVGLVPDLRAGSPTSGWRCVLRPALVPEAVPPSHRLVLHIRAGFLFSGPGVCVWGASTVYFYVFLRDVVTLWVNSVFLSHLIVNEGLHRWLLLSDVANPFLGSSRRIHTSSFGLLELLVAGGRTITWLVPELCQWAVFSWPHLLLSYEP